MCPASNIKPHTRNKLVLVAVQKIDRSSALLTLFGEIRQFTTVRCVIISQRSGNISITSEDRTKERKQAPRALSDHRKKATNAPCDKSAERRPLAHCAVSNEPVFLYMHSYIKSRDKIDRVTDAPPCTRKGKNPPPNAVWFFSP